MLSIQQLKDKIRQYKFERLSRQLNFDPNEVIILSSDPRGGSTWFAQLINAIPHSAVVNEPLNLGQSPMAVKLKMSWRQYIPPVAQWPEAKLMFDKIFSGKYLNNGTTNYSTLAVSYTHLRAHETGRNL